MLTGIARIDRKTKNLAKRINIDDIAIIKHRDIDEIAAESLVEKKVKVVVNMDKSISGKYPNLGPKVLIDANIPILDNVQENLFEFITEGEEIQIINHSIYKNGQLIGNGQWITNDILDNKISEAKKNLSAELDKFIENTLEYAKKEKDIILNGISIPDIKTDISGRHAIIVVRGPNYKEDLNILQAYIQEENPVLIGVDGGADALIEFGHEPDIIIGDMDSVSDTALKKCREIIVHAYTDGKAPGLDRINKLGLQGMTIPAPGTSEDIAMLLAYDKGADLIVALGSHSNMIDFLEKGRPGMASTFLVRLKIGAKLIDAKGVNKLYHTGIKIKYFFVLVLAALFPLLIIGMHSPLIQDFLTLFQMRLRLLFNF